MSRPYCDDRLPTPEPLSYNRDFYGLSWSYVLRGNWCLFMSTLGKLKKSNYKHQLSYNFQTNEISDLNKQP